MISIKQSARRGDLRGTCSRRAQTFRRQLPSSKQFTAGTSHHTQCGLLLLPVRFNRFLPSLIEQIWVERWETRLLPEVLKVLKIFFFQGRWRQPWIKKVVSKNCNFYNTLYYLGQVLNKDGRSTDVEKCWVFQKSEWTKTGYDKNNKHRENTRII